MLSLWKDGEEHAGVTISWGEHEQSDRQKQVELTHIGLHIGPITYVRMNGFRIH